MKKLIFLNIIFISLVSAARDYTFERITSKDGLSQNNVLSIYQCSDGYMWFATYDGLNRYDGYDFKVYRNSTEDIHSLSSNLIQCITEDHHKNLWIGTFNEGICRFNKETEKFTRFKNTPNNPNLLAGNMISNIVCDSKNNIWLSSSEGVTFIKTLPNDSIETQLFVHTENPKSLLHMLIFGVYEDSKGQFFVMNRGGLDLMHKSDKGEIQNSFYHLINTDTLGDIRQVMEIPEGYLINHYYGMSLLKLNPHSPEHSELIALPNHFSDNFIIDLKGDIWSGGNEGLFRLEHNPNVHMPYIIADHFIDSETDTEAEEFLSHKVIRSITLDNTGIIWIGTNGGGILKCNTTKAIFRHYKKTKQKGSISANKVWSIFEDPMHNLWFSTEGGGLNLLTADKNKDYKTGFKAFAVNDRFGQNFAFKVVDFTKNNTPEYLVGVGYTNKIVKVKQHRNDWKITPILPEISKQIMTLCTDEYGAVWLGSYNGGLYRLVSDGQSMNLSQFTPDNSSLPTKIIRSVFEAPMDRH